MASGGPVPRSSKIQAPQEEPSHELQHRQRKHQTHEQGELTQEHACHTGRHHLPDKLLSRPAASMRAEVNATAKLSISDVHDSARVTSAAHNSQASRP
ncbi:hypothetical protein VTN96DRAFT_1573 [Rasamsonia emersonii]